MNTTTFDINKIDAEKLKSPATWNQCGGLSKKFARKADKMDWRLQKQINKYSDAISAYLADNLEA